MTTKVTSAKQSNETLDAVWFQIMRVKEAVVQHSHLIVALLTMVVTLTCEESLRLLWAIENVHPGVVLLCATSLFIGRRTR